jgi:hypothetical protein
MFLTPHLGGELRTTKQEAFKQKEFERSIRLAFYFFFFKMGGRVTMRNIFL